MSCVAGTRGTVPATMADDFDLLDDPGDIAPRGPGAVPEGSAGSLGRAGCGAAAGRLPERWRHLLYRYLGLGPSQALDTVLRKTVGREGPHLVMLSRATTSIRTPRNEFSGFYAHTHRPLRVGASGCTSSRRIATATLRRATSGSWSFGRSSDGPSVVRCWRRRPPSRHTCRASWTTRLRRTGSRSACGSSHSSARTRSTARARMPPSGWWRCTSTCASAGRATTSRTSPRPRASIRICCRRFPRAA